MNQTRTSAFTCERPDALDSYRPSGSNVGKRVAELSRKEPILTKLREASEPSVHVPPGLLLSLGD